MISTTTRHPTFTRPLKAIHAKWLARSPRQQRVIRWALALALIVWLAFKVTHIALILFDLNSDARELQAVTENGTLAFWENAPGKLERQFVAVRNDLRDLHSEVGWFAYLGPLFGWVPQYGGEAAQLPALLEFGDNAADGAYTTLLLFQNVSAEMDAGRAAGKPVGVAAVVALQRYQPAIDRARQQLVRAQAARAALNPARLSPRTRNLIDRMDKLMPMWSTAVNALALAPTLLGANEPRDYLLIVQNSDELRPTGGFVSIVVRVRMDKGDIGELDFRDSYAVDNPQVAHPAAPAPLQKYMDAAAWTVRDANWSPDFPTSASDLTRLYSLDQGLVPYGVIATNLNMVSRLLQLVGTIRVPGSDEEVTPNNAMSVLQNYWASPEGKGHTADWWQHRKDFMGKLMVTMLERLRNGQFDKTQFVHTLSDSFASKDLLLFLADGSAQRIVEQAGWAGKLDTSPGDKLMIVDANVGFNKADPTIARQANYAIKLDNNGSGQATLTLNYTNTNRANNTPCVHQAYYPPTYQELMQACYWDFVRVVAANGARLQSVSDNLDAAGDAAINNRAVFSNYFVLPRGAQRQLHYVYQVPNAVDDSNLYRLHIEKQPGAPTWTVHVQVTLPEGTTTYDASPAPTRVNGATLHYDLTLDRDWDIALARPAPLVSGIALSASSAVLSVALIGAWWYRRRRAPKSTSQ